MMNMPTNRPTITTELVDRFARYHKKNPTWGSLHIVLDDDNFRNSDVQFCQQRAKDEGDDEGHALATILLSMNTSQRARIGQRVEEWGYSDE